MQWNSVHTQTGVCSSKPLPKTSHPICFLGLLQQILANGQLEQWKFVVPPSGGQKLEIEEQAGWVSADSVTEKLFHSSLSAAGGCLAVAAHSSFMWCSACVCLCSNFPFYMDLSHPGLGPTLL